MSFATNIWPAVAKSRSLTSSKISRWPARIESWRCQRWCAGSRCRSAKLSATSPIPIKLSPRSACMAVIRATEKMSSSARILVTGAEQRWRAMVSDWLRDGGFEVSEIESGALAAAGYLEEKVDLVLAQFGAGTGVTLFKQLAAMVESSGVFVVATLDRAISPEMRAAVLALRVDGFINGDPAQDEMMASIRAFIRQK